MKKNNGSSKRIFACDWLDRYAGAERVIHIICDLYPPSQVYALANVMSRKDIQRIGFDEIPIHTSYLWWLGKSFRYALPMFPSAVHKRTVNLPILSERRLLEEDYPVLRAMGITTRHLTRTAMMRVTPAAVAAGTIAMAGSILLSERFPIGLGRDYFFLLVNFSILFCCVTNLSIQKTFFWLDTV